MIKKLLLLLFLAPLSWGANHYVLAGASGTGTGADWTNAYTDFGATAGKINPASMTRGDVYFVGTGTYSATTFHTPISGTSTITVKGATAADHGTATGWSSAFGVDVTQATWTSPLMVWDGYYILDGNTGTPSGGSTSYGFNTAVPVSCASGNTAVAIGPGGSTVNNVQISHFYLLACSGDVETNGIYLQTTTTASNHVYSYNYLDGFGVAVFDHSTGVSIDHNYLINAFSSVSHHGNQLDFIDAEVNPSVSFNRFVNCAGTVCMGANDNGSTCSAGVTGAKIYGNVFNGTLTGGGTQAIGDGIIGATSNCFITNALVYNNTFTGTTSGWFQGCVTAQPTCASATGNTAENNIVWNATCALGSGVTTHDYNSYLSCTDTAPTETQGQIAALNPFVNSTANNFALALNTSAWLPLSSPYNLDLTGALRTSSRGAYQLSLPQSSIVTGKSSITGKTTIQ